MITLTYAQALHHLEKLLVGEEFRPLVVSYTDPLRRVLAATYSAENASVVIRWSLSPAYKNDVHDTSSFIAGFSKLIGKDANLKFETTDKPKVLIAHWYVAGGTIPESELAQTDGDLEGLLEAIETMWLDGLEQLTSNDIDAILDSLRHASRADHLKLSDANTDIITISEFDRDDPDIQYLFHEFGEED